MQSYYIRVVIALLFRYHIYKSNNRYHIAWSNHAKLFGQLIKSNLAQLTQKQNISPLLLSRALKISAIMIFATKSSIISSLTRRFFCRFFRRLKEILYLNFWGDFWSKTFVLGFFSTNYECFKVLHNRSQNNLKQYHNSCLYKFFETFKNNKNFCNITKKNYCASSELIISFQKFFSYQSQNVEFLWTAFIDCIYSFFKNAKNVLKLDIAIRVFFLMKAVNELFCM